MEGDVCVSFIPPNQLCSSQLEEKYSYPTTDFASNITLLPDCQTNMPSSKLIFTEKTVDETSVSADSLLKAR